MTRIAAYVHLNRLQKPTGVGRHILRMVEGLQKSNEVDLSLLVSRAHARDFPPQGFWPGINATSFPLSFGAMQRIWVALNWPAAETWCGELDWVYCPAESYVPCRRAKLAVTVHDLHAFETNLPWSSSLAHRKFRLKWRILFRRILSEADRLLAVSEFTKRRLIELLGAREESIEIVGNGVDELFFNDAEALVDSRFQPGNYVAIVGGLSFRKGGDIILAVAKELEKQLPDLKIVIAGNSEPIFVQEAARRTNVVQLEYADERDIHRLLNHSVCLLFPSRYEGFGIPAVEAMASGTPVIVSNCGALPEIVADAGIFATAPNEMLSAIAAFWRDSALRSDYGARGRKRAEEFRWSRCNERLLKIFTICR
jgi:glycosyltransferase involved in cell wall biosynthesis